MIPLYSPKLLALNLFKTVDKHRTELTKPTYPISKMEWITKTSMKVIDLLEEEANKFNKLNQKLDVRVGNREILACSNAILTYLIKILK